MLDLKDKLKKLFKKSQIGHLPHVSFFSMVVANRGNVLTYVYLAHRTADSLSVEVPVSILRYWDKCCIHFVNEEDPEIRVPLSIVVDDGSYLHATRASASWDHEPLYQKEYKGGGYIVLIPFTAFKTFQVD